MTSRPLLPSSPLSSSPARQLSHSVQNTSSESPMAQGACALGSATVASDCPASSEADRWGATWGPDLRRALATSGADPDRLRAMAQRLGLPSLAENIGESGAAAGQPRLVITADGARTLAPPLGRNLSQGAAWGGASSASGAPDHQEGVPVGPESKLPQPPQPTGFGGWPLWTVVGPWLTSREARGPGRALVGWGFALGSIAVLGMALAWGGGTDVLGPAGGQGTADVLRGDMGEGRPVGVSATHFDIPPASVRTLAATVDGGVEGRAREGDSLVGEETALAADDFDPFTVLEDGSDDEDEELFDVPGMFFGAPMLVPMVGASGWAAVAGY